MISKERIREDYDIENKLEKIYKICNLRKIMN